jgi:Xaa-Pro dipeptidase
MQNELLHNDPGNLYLHRQEQLVQALMRANLFTLALIPGPSLTYMTGLHFHLSERPIIAFFTVDHPPLIILPELEIAKTTQLPYPVITFTYGEDPAGWPAVVLKAMKSIDLIGRSIGIEPRQMRVLEYYLLQEADSQARFTNAEEIIAALRMIKDATEASLMRKAVQIAQDALLSALKKVQVGLLERELAAEITLELLRHGSDAQLVFSPIVSGGPNSANPHASPSSRALAPGDLLVIDWGASFGGYISDLTRTFAIGHAEPELQKIADLVRQANTAGRLACAPGVTAASIDAAARQLIEQAGYGQYFFHRTGHGIGMEGHEEPYIRSGNALKMKPGMTFTIEPGIYLPNRGGVRVEDNVMITASGVECFSDLPRELIVLPLA